MADNFEVVGAQVVAERLTPTELIDRQRVYVRALPSNVVFPLDFAVGVDITPAEGDMSTIADTFNNAAKVPGVVDIVVNEDTDAGGYIVLTGTTTVVSTSGKSSTEVSSAYSALGRAAWKDQVAAAVARLDALEAL